ncbi:MAG: hypothetical protein ACK587_04205 [Cyanobacteriota bacterium]|jgi:flagellar basal body-associated protein FliL
MLMTILLNFLAVVGALAIFAVCYWLYFVISLGLYITQDQRRAEKEKRKARKKPQALI